MKVHSFSSFIIVAVSVFLISGCQKIRDYVEAHPDAEVKSCAITKFIHRPPYSDYIDTLTIFYNILGDPIKAIRPEPVTGAPNFLFRYKNGRLSEFIGVYSNGITTESWHRYFYDADGRVAVDSVYIFADMVNEDISNPFDSYVITFIYDNKNRIIQEKKTFSDGSIVTQDFQYNADGNLVGFAYGQGISIRRSNKVWMFLDRNYSVNDRAGSGDYNAFHMPGLIELEDESFDYFFGNPFARARIHYLCDSGY